MPTYKVHAVTRRSTGWYKDIEAPSMEAAEDGVLSDFSDWDLGCDGWSQEWSDSEEFVDWVEPPTEVTSA